MPTDTEPLELLGNLLDAAKAAGAGCADAVLFEAAAISVAQRLGAPEKLERAESRDLGLRVLIGKRQAMVSSTDFGAAALDEDFDIEVIEAEAADEATDEVSGGHAGHGKGSLSQD